MIRVEVVHTSALEMPQLDELRRFLDSAFDGGFDDHDWDHALGGMHGIVRQDDRIVAHGSVVQRRVLLGGSTLRAGYVEGVAVHDGYRRRGYGKAIMLALDPVIRRGYEIGALSAGDEAGRLYTSLGWKRWQGATWALTPSGLERTEEEDETTYILELNAPLDLGSDIACDWRDGDLW